MIVKERDPEGAWNIEINELKKKNKISYFQKIFLVPHK